MGVAVLMMKVEICVNETITTSRSAVKYKVIPATGNSISISDCSEKLITAFLQFSFTVNKCRGLVCPMYRNVANSPSVTVPKKKHVHIEIRGPVYICTSLLVLMLN